MLLEVLCSWGVRKACFIGWCGSIDERARIGDLIVPLGAWIDEGTSVHYDQNPEVAVPSDDALHNILLQGLVQRNADFHSGLIWTTDAIFRETPSQIHKYRQLGALAVEMELSALLSVARFYGLAMAAVLAVSDELFSLKWRTGFKTEAFQQSRLMACNLITDLFGP